mmetsp:Transcript_1833/g.5511  ORF Transcript_1833/g.5511 Transcript_1833/m.5511 type:complete len:1225 (-) Transcript_1833:78-3752(-)
MMDFPCKLRLFFLGIIGILCFSASTYSPFQTSPEDWEAPPQCQSNMQSSEGDIVFVAGFSRTATTSMAAAMQELGFETLHWKQWVEQYLDVLTYTYNGLIPNLDVSKIIGNRAKLALLDSPMVSPLLEDLLNAYPHAKVIQTSRNSSTWFESYVSYHNSQWMYDEWRAPVLYSLSYVARALRLSSCLRWFDIIEHSSMLDLETLPQLFQLYRRSDEIVLGTWMPQRDTWIILKEAREAKIRSQVPPEKLLVFDAGQGDGWEQLEQFLGVRRKRGSASAFPAQFSAASVYNASFQQAFLQHNRTAIFMAAAILASIILLFAVSATCFSSDFIMRFQVLTNLIASYPRLRSIYHSRKAAGHFDYGETSPSWQSLGLHKATQELSALRSTPGGSSAVFMDDFKVLGTYLPTDQAVGACLACVGLAAADLYELRGGRAQTVIVRRSDAGAVPVAGYLHMRVDPSDDGYAGMNGFKHMVEAEGTVNPVRKPYLCRDSRHVFLHGGFPKLKKGILEFLQSECTVSGIASRTIEWDAEALEKALQTAGLAASKCATPAEWRNSAQGQIIQRLPLVLLEPRHGPRVARKLSTCAVTPLSDVIVIDLSHVIASPVVGRTLSEHGALVIKVVTQKRPRRPAFDEETNCGKYPLEIDIRCVEGKAQLWALLHVADILIDGYTTGALERLGFCTDAVEAVNPSLIYVDVTCYGHVGPRKFWKGFQQNANFATGTAVIEDEELLAYQLVSQLDYATGLVGAYGAILALCQRQQSGRASRVHTSLCRVATWMGLFGASCPSFSEFAGSALRLLWGMAGHVERTGNALYVRPAIQMSVTPPQRNVGFRRWWRAGNVDHYGASNEKTEACAKNVNDCPGPRTYFSIDYSGDAVELQIRGRTDIVGACTAHIPEKISWSAAMHFPLIMRTRADTELTSEVAEEVAHSIKRDLLNYGAIIFRGLQLQTPQDVSKLIHMVAPELGWVPTTVAGGGTYRSLEAPNVQTSSNEPPSCAMEPHMDKAHQIDFPECIFFAMMVELPMNAGGETIVTDMRAVTSELHQNGIIDRFEANGGVLYEKLFWSAGHSDGQMQGFTWQRAFGFEDKASVERHLSSTGSKWRWLENDTLKVSNVEPVLRRHCLSNEALWVNGVHTNNSSYYRHAQHIDTSRGSPMDTFFGNGTSISEDMLAQIRGTFWRHSVPLRLRATDLLVVDNMLVAHGRMSWPSGLARKLTLTHFKRTSV